MHISEKLAIVGFVFVVLGMVLKLVSGFRLDIWGTPPEGLVVEWGVFTALHLVGFVLFVVAVVHYFWKGRKAG